MYLYHYFDKRTKPFQSLTSLSTEKALALLEEIRQTRPKSFCAKRDAAYIEKRRNCEALVRKEFLAKGGTVETEIPQYMVVEHCPWLYSWYEQPDFLKIPAADFDTNMLSFTYGDSMPTFSPLVNDGKEYRKKVYTYQEIIQIIKKYGLPQNWNADGFYGPERYIEVQVWCDVRKNEQFADFIISKNKSS